MTNFKARLALWSNAAVAWLVASTAVQAAQTNAPIAWDEISAKAGADYSGDGLSVTSTRDGARLHCVFQRLDGEATSEGLWLTSTVSNQGGDRFRVTAAAVGRNETRATDIPLTGKVSIEHQSVRFMRPVLVEEYSVSMDGVRQDFVLLEKPAGSGELQVHLSVSGARVEASAGGANLILEKSGRKIAYSRLKVTDANGKDLPARIEAADPSQSAVRSPQSTIALAVVVNDTDATYPIRIDPTFSDANWISMGIIPGADNTVYAVVVDGSGNLYIGGIFTAAAGSTANHIAKWNGSSWSEVGSGMNGNVLALAVLGSDVYAAGSFTTAGGGTANRIAKWNGSSWSALGSGLNNAVYALAVSGSDLYAGGDLSTAGGSAANRIAKWNGSSWTALGSGVNDTVYSLAVSGSDVYAGGSFTTAGGSAANRIAKWNGSSWSALGSGVNNLVEALAVSGSDVYAGGSFTTAGGSTANYIAKWNGSSWSALGSPGINGEVNALAVSGSDLYVGGYLTTADGITASFIAKWTGSSWSSLGSGLNSAVRVLLVLGSDVYAGGLFTTADGTTVNRIAKWNGSSWSGFGSGLNNTVYALAVSGGDLYAGGIFTTTGGSAANYIAKWNGSSWSNLGSGPNGNVLALTVSGSDLYAAGSFTSAGGNAADRIAKWNGSSWSALGSGLNNAVYALAASGSDVYAGGDFTSAGGSGANYIAKWNGSGWSALGSGVNSSVYALAVSGSDVYAGGFFTTAGGSAANRIAKWNGSSWSALGSGVNNLVEALVVSGSDVYAGGSFTTAGGSTANYIAKWNGSSWSALGSPGINGEVNALLVSGSDLYVGGYLTTAGGSAANRIAKWNGSSWSALGSGLNNGVRTLLVSGSDLYVGGVFTSAGDKGSAYAAKAVVCSDLVLSPGTLGSGIAGVGYSQSVTASVGSAPYSYATTGGTLPGGVSLSSGGLISGTPTNMGLFNFTITATDANGCTGSSNYAVNIFSAPFITVQPQPQTNLAGTTATFSVTADGTAPLAYQWLKDGTNLADGDSLSGSMTSSLTNNRMAVGDTGSYSVIITNAYGAVTSSVATLTVICPDIALTPPTLEDGTYDAAYSQSLTAISGMSAYSYALSSGALPTGLNLSASGTLSGTPTVPGIYNFSVLATDTNGCIGGQSYALTIHCPTITVNPVSLPASILNESYTQNITWFGGAGSNSFSITAGTLPAGVFLSPSGVLSGTPTGGGNFNFTITAIDTNGCTGVRAYSFTVVMPAYVVTPPGSSTVSQNESVTFTVTPGGTPPFSYQWQLNGTNISDATSSSHTVPSVAVTNVGVYTVVVCNNGGCVTSMAGTLTLLALDIHPVLHIYGPVGTMYRIDYSENLGSNWVTLTNLSLPENPYLFPDPAPARQIKRFYRAVKQ